MKASELEWAERSVRATRPFRRDPDARPLSQRGLGTLQTLDRSFTRRAVEFDEAGHTHCLSPDWNAEQLGLGHHAQAKRQGLIERRDIVQGLVIRHHDERCPSASVFDATDLERN